jgi:hypothetical protein
MSARVFRTAVTASLFLSLAAAGGALAGPKKSCDLITDAENDTFLLRTQDSVGAYGPPEASLDIVGGDLASDDKTITGVLRVAKLATTAGTSPVGLSFRLQFALPGQTETNLYMTANIVAGSESFAVGVRDILTNTSTKLADATGTFDVEKSEVRISAPLAAFKEAGGIEPGAKLTLADLDQTSSRPSGAGPSVFADVAISDKTYTAGNPSCVEVGK